MPFITLPIYQRKQAHFQAQSEELGNSFSSMLTITYWLSSRKYIPFVSRIAFVFSVLSGIGRGGGVVVGWCCWVFISILGTIVHKALEFPLFAVRVSSGLTGKYKYNPPTGCQDFTHPSFPHRPVVARPTTSVDPPEEAHVLSQCLFPRTVLYTAYLSIVPSTHCFAPV